MRDLDALLAEVEAVLNLPALPRLDPPPAPWVVSTAGVDRAVETVRRLLDRPVPPPDSPLLTGRWGDAAGALFPGVDYAEPLPAAERPRPRPPRPFPVSESDALARRAEQKQPARPRSWFGGWRRG